MSSTSKSPPAKDEDEDEEHITWEVKAVLDKKVNPITNGVEFLIEWKNWEGPPTWEPEENCDCKTLIKRFEKELQKREASVYEERSESSRRTPVRGRRNSRTPRGGRLSRTPGERRSSRISSQIILDTITIDDSSSTPPPQEPQQALSQPITSKQHKAKPTQRPLAKTTTQTQVPHCSKDAFNTEQVPNTQNSPQFPRSVSPAPQVLESSSSEAEEVYDNYNKLIKQRRLKLKEIVGAINSDEIFLIVKWHGISDLEKVPLQILRRFFCQDVLDFLLERIKWT